MRYEVRALARDQVTTVLVDALDEADARRQVAAQALRPLSVRPGSGRILGGGGRSSFSLLHFTQELLTLLEAGLSVVESLDAMLDKERRPDARSILARLSASLREGRSLSAALERQGATFPPLYVSIVRAAERTSNLPQALGRYADYQSRLDAARTKAVSASIYPLLLLVVGGVVTLFLLGYVVPRFAGVYQGAGRDIPWLSARLLDVGRWLGAHGVAALAAALAMAGAAAVALRQPAARRRLGGLLQRLPLLAPTLRSFQLARLYLTLGMLLDGGMPVVQALALVADTVSPELRERVHAAAGAIRHGESLSQAFDRNGLATPVGLRILRVGERSGQMGAMMGRIARLHDAEVARFIDWFSRVFEPALMAAIGVVVGLVVVLLYMPIFDLAGSLQ